MRRISVEFAAIHGHELFRHQLATAFFDDAAAFPTQAVAVAGEEGVDLVGHVFLEFVFAGGFDPGAFGFHDAEAVDRTVEHVVAPTLIATPFFIFLGDAGSFNAGFHQLKSIFVGAKAEFDERELFFRQFGTKPWHFPYLEQQNG